MQNNIVQKILIHLQFLYLLKYLRIKVYSSNMILSIYKKETRPSLKIYPETNSYYCFTAKKGGSIIKFYMKFRKVPFKVAIRELENILAKQDLGIQRVSNKQETKIEGLGKLKVGEHRLFKKYYYRGIRKKNLPNDKAKIYAIKCIKTNRQKCLSEVSDFIYEYCHKNKFSPEGLNYLRRDRKLTLESIVKFKIMEVLNPFVLSSILKTEFSLDTLIYAGIFNEKGNFIFGYHKILIPYLKDGQISYLRGREFPIDTSNIGKYIGVSGFTIKRIFNEDILKTLVPGDKLNLCEGEFDTIIASQDGYKAIGFPGINGIPFEELKKLNLGQYKLYNAFDADKAGDKAAQELCDKLGVTMVRNRPKDGKDLSEVYDA